MKLKTFVVLPAILSLALLVPVGRAQPSPAASDSSTESKTRAIDGTDIDRQLVEREEKVGQLSLEEQLKLRAAQVKAAEDPAVLAALEKRNQAITEFRAALRAAALKADPSIAPILDKIAVGNQPGF